MTNINTTVRRIPDGFDPSGWTPTPRTRIPGVLTTRSHTLQRFGDSSAFGAVYQIGNTDYVLKIMGPKTTKNRNIFANEVGIGSISGIQAVGPRIYCYKETSNQLMYVMDNVTSMCPPGKTCTSESINRYFGNRCPVETHPIYQMVYDTLMKFYQITKGWHGDLHTGNMMVLLDQNRDLVSVKIIDYGAHRKFTNSTVPNCLEDIFNKIETNFIQGRGYTAGAFKIPNNYQPYRKNQYTLKTFFPTSARGREFNNVLRNINRRRRPQPVVTPRPQPVVTLQGVPVAIPYQPMLKKVLNKINTKLLMNMGARGLVLAKNIGGRGLVLAKNIGGRGLALVKNVGTKGIVATRTLIKNELNRRKKILENKERKKTANRILFEAEQAKIANKIIAEETAKIYKREKEAEERRIQKQIELNKIMQNELNKRKKNEQNVRKKLYQSPFTKPIQQNVRENPFAKQVYTKSKRKMFSYTPTNQQVYRKYTFELNEKGKLKKITQ